MGPIASNKRGGEGGGHWQTDAQSPACSTIGQKLDAHQSQIIESCSEQPWVEFCMGLNQPAFLLPITGFAEL